MVREQFIKVLEAEFDKKFKSAFMRRTRKQQFEKLSSLYAIAMMMPELKTRQEIENKYMELNK